MLPRRSSDLFAASIASRTERSDTRNGCEAFVYDVFVLASDDRESWQKDVRRVLNDDDWTFTCACDPEGAGVGVSLLMPANKSFSMSAADFRDFTTSAYRFEGGKGVVCGGESVSRLLAGACLAAVSGVS